MSKLMPLGLGTMIVAAATACSDVASIQISAIKTIKITDGICEPGAITLASGGVCSDMGTGYMAALAFTNVTDKVVLDGHIDTAYAVVDTLEVEYSQPAGSTLTAPPKQTLAASARVEAGGGKTETVVTVLPAGIVAAGATGTIVASIRGVGSFGDGSGFVTPALSFPIDFAPCAIAECDPATATIRACSAAGKGVPGAFVCVAKPAP